MLHINYKIIFVFLLINIVSTPIKAETGERSHFMYHGPGIAAAALGETYTSFGNDISVVYYNPALLHRLPASYISAAHTFLFDTARYDFLGFSYAFERSAFSIIGTQLYRNNIEVRENIDDIPYETHNSKVLLSGAYSDYLKKLRLSYGFTINYLKYDIYDLNDYGLSFDVGFAKRIATFGNTLAKCITLDTGLNLKNIVQKPIKLISEEEKLPFLIKYGLSGKITLFPRYNKIKNVLSYDELLLAADLNCRESGTYLSYAAYYKFLNILTLRAGYNENITFGAGINVGDFIFDYAYSLETFTEFHNIGFSYKFNEKSEEQVSDSFTEEFQKVYKKAIRIYDRYIRNAKEMAEHNNYKDAVNILKKAIPLNPHNNTHAKELLSVYQNTISADQSNKYISKANISKNNDVESAYRNYLRAYDINYTDRNIITFINNLYDGLSDDKKEKIDKIKLEYINRTAQKITVNISNNDYLAAEKKFQKLNTIAPDSSVTINLNTKLKDNKELYLYKIASLGMENIKKKNFVEAYKQFYKANKLNPKDSTFKDQIEITKKKYYKKKDYTLQDNMYADKLYYLASISFATGENPVLLYNELLAFNSLHNNLPVLTTALNEGGIINK